MPFWKKKAKDTKPVAVYDPEASQDGGLEASPPLPPRHSSAQADQLGGDYATLGDAMAKNKKLTSLMTPAVSREPSTAQAIVPSNEARGSVTYSSIALIKKFVVEEPAYVPLEQIQTERRKRTGEAGYDVAAGEAMTTVKEEAEVYADEMGLRAKPELPPALSLKMSDLTMDRMAPCQKCKALFSNDGLYQRGQFYYCKPDFLELFCEKCTACKEYIQREGVRTLDHPYHLNCLRCVGCRVPLQSGAQAFMVGDKLFCQHCEPSKGKSQSPCGRCRELVKGESVEANGKIYHPKCFICCVCHGLIRDVFFNIDGGIYCKEDYLKKYSSKCLVCHQSIKGKFLQIDDTQQHIACAKCHICAKTARYLEELEVINGTIYHITCLTCSICKENLKDHNDRCTRDNKIYCLACNSEFD